MRNFNSAHTENRRVHTLCCFFATPKLVLRKNGKHEPRNRNRRSVHALIRHRITLALQGQWSQLYEDAIEAFGLSTNHLDSPIDPIRRCKKAIQSGSVGKAAEALLATDNPVPNTAQNAQILSSLHPKPTIPVSPTPRNSLPPAYAFTEADVRREIRSLPFCTSPGADGFRPSHVKLIPHIPGGTEPSRSTLTEFTTLCNRIASADIPSTLSPYIAGGLLLGLPKTDPSSLRPIAIGLTVRRLVCCLLMKAILRDAAADIQSYFLPNQLAVGTKGGTEAIIHATREVLRIYDPADVAVLLIDAKNAFNSIERSIILQQTILKTPGLARWVHYAYGTLSVLHFGSFIILSMTGTQQGDPLSMLLFALALQPIIEDLVKHFPDLPLNAFFADDGTLVLKPSQVQPVLSFLIARGENAGFIVNLIKTKLWLPSPLHSLLINSNTIPCTIITEGAFKLLGAPVGDDTACRQQCLARVDEVALLWERLTQLQDLQISYHILRVCAGACRLTYLLRCTPPQLTKSGANKFDFGMRRVFQLTRRTLTDSAWRNATLPIRNGGLGLTPAVTMCGPAYVSSLTMNTHLIQGLLSPLHFQLRPNIQTHLSTLQDNFTLPPNLLPHSLVQRALNPSDREKVQHEFFQLINSKRLSTAEEHQSPRDKVRRQSVSTVNASLLFTALPRSDIGTRVEPEIWSTIVDKPLGNPIYSGVTQCPRCAANGNTRVLDVYGHHASICPTAEGTVRRHNGLTDKLYSLMAFPPYGLQLMRELHFPQDLHQPPESRRKMDILVDDLSFAQDDKLLM